MHIEINYEGMLWPVFREPHSCSHDDSGTWQPNESLMFKTGDGTPCYAFFTTQEKLDAFIPCFRQAMGLTGELRLTVINVTQEDAVNLLHSLEGKEHQLFIDPTPPGSDDVQYVAIKPFAA